MVTTIPGLLMRGLLFALLACSLLVNPVAAPAAFFEEDGDPPIGQETEEDAAAGPDRIGEAESSKATAASGALLRAAGEPPQTPDRTLST